ncbi:hypothetical protein ACWD5R_39575 [Streptomyces sp. NPDC002514]|uniref:hypothetical protein n=1 Tax=Streptomyces sp. NPDC001270 TaxID=3364554 RepID=UPI00369347C5
MTKVYERTEDGTTTRVTAEEALNEGHAAMTDRVTIRAHVRKISEKSGHYDITYKDGRRVVLAPVNVKPAAKLTPKMQDALDKIRANGGRVGNGLNAFRALGVNARSVTALENRGLLKHRSENGTAWLYLAA